VAVGQEDALALLGAGEDPDEEADVFDGAHRRWPSFRPGKPEIRVGARSPHLED
jgi:hypothetical protein